eukprot:TRINITY_DN4683_c0_g1_i1.p1 TRINITY_DN4683_c0_g1~~TRINITY_DN4683_c0_g1_i1.p1  ORF type:complete len:117 (-),score=10.60 TRINITY_DN4683_c0_g1_i1:106-456(-)
MESTFHRKTSFNGGQNTGRIVDGEKPGSYGDKYPELEDIIIRDDTVENHVVEMLWCYREGRLSIHGFKALLEKANVESLMWKNQVNSEKMFDFVFVFLCKLKNLTTRLVSARRNTC